ncbi:MAG: TadE family protein [Actinomycetota bacterium]
MKFRSGHRGGSAADETGATGVEMALVLPLLVMLIAGVMDFGMVFSDLMSLRQGVGAGVRHGIVAQSGASSSCTVTGTTASGDTLSLICLVKDRIALDDASTRVKIAFPGSKVRGGSLVICAQYPMESITTMLDPIMNGELTSRVEMRIEQDLSTLDAAEETPVDGGDWTWCA